jgi:hypothetical protein
VEVYLQHFNLFPFGDTLKECQHLHAFFFARRTHVFPIYFHVTTNESAMRTPMPNAHIAVVETGILIADVVLVEREESLDQREVAMREDSPHATADSLGALFNTHNTRIIQTDLACRVF